MRLIRRLRVDLLMYAVSCWMAVCGSLPAQSERLEYELKSACIYNFLKFVEFLPASAVPGDSAISVCVVGRADVGSVLEQKLAGKLVGGKPVIVTSLPDAARLAAGGKRYHVVFLVAPVEGELASCVDALRRAAVLTIGESPGFCEKGGIINFKMENGRIRFEVNVNAARQANLRISSQLLKLATVIGQVSGTTAGVAWHANG